MLKYIFKQTVYHLLFTGAVYLVLAAPYFNLGDTSIWLWRLTGLISAAAFYYDVESSRPIPANPMQQFTLNCFIATYGLFVALATGLMLDFYGLMPLVICSVWSPIYYYFLLGLITRVDRPDTQDAHGRKYTQWERQLIEARRQPRQ